MQKLKHLGLSASTMASWISTHDITSRDDYGTVVYVYSNDERHDTSVKLEHIIL